MQNSNKNLIQIKKTVKRFLPVSKILLFGSRARGNNIENSDYDILVIIENNISVKDKFPLKTIIRKSLLKYGIFTDVLIQSNNEIEKKKDLPGHIIKTILKEGVTL